MVLATGPPACYRAACEHRRDVERFLAQSGYTGCAVEVLPPAS